MESPAPVKGSVAVQLPAAAAAAAQHGPFLSNPLLSAHHYITSFDGEAPFLWMGHSPHVPLLIVSAYIAIVHVTPRLLNLVAPRGTPLPGLSAIVAVWNLFFSLGSFLGFLYCMPILYRLITTTDRDLPGLAPKQDWHTGEWDTEPHVRGGLYTSLCYWNRSIFLDGATGFWLVTFNLSKILELADTVFLLLKRKPVPFLHWYHHATVMLFCWHAHQSSISNGLGFAVMNMAVHSIMYFYFFMCECGQRKRVRPFAPVVTLLQLTQMFAGMALVLYTTYLYLTHPKGCDTKASSLAFGIAMYFSYILLFVRFYQENYGQGRRRERRDRHEDWSRDQKLE